MKFSLKFESKSESESSLLDGNNRFGEISVILSSLFIYFYYSDIQNYNYYFNQKIVFKYTIKIIQNKNISIF